MSSSNQKSGQQPPVATGSHGVEKQGKMGCNGDCLRLAKTALENAAHIADSVGKHQSSLCKRFEFLVDACGNDRHKHAEIVLENALALYEANFGQQHHLVASMLAELASLYSMHGDAEKARYLKDWAAEIMRLSEEEPSHEFFSLMGLNPSAESEETNVEKPQSN